MDDLRFVKISETMETDQYVTMTVLQMEKEFGDSEEAQAFIAEITKGAMSAVMCSLHTSRAVLVQ